MEIFSHEPFHQRLVNLLKWKNVFWMEIFSQVTCTLILETWSNLVSDNHLLFKRGDFIYHHIYLCVIPSFYQFLHCAYFKFENDKIRYKSNSMEFYSLERYQLRLEAYKILVCEDSFPYSFFLLDVVTFDVLLENIILCLF